MPLSPIDTASFQKIALGIDRPEDVVVSAEGRVFASDHQCAVAEILPDGSFVRMGPRGGAPNGINMDLQGRILIANFGIGIISRAAPQMNIFAVGFPFILLVGFASLYLLVPYFLPILDRLFSGGVETLVLLLRGMALAPPR